MADFFAALLVRFGPEGAALLVRFGPQNDRVGFRLARAVLVSYTSSVQPAEKVFLAPRDLVTRAWFILPALLSLACSETSPERPPPAEQGRPFPGAVGTRNPAMGGAGDGASDGSGGAFAELSLDFFVFSDDLFVRTERYDEPTQMVVFGEDRTTYQRFEYQDGSFDEGRIRRSEGVFIAVAPSFDSDVVMTLAPQDTRATDLSLPLVRRSVLESILSGLTIPTVINDQAAQLLLRLVDAQGQPLSGVSLPFEFSDQVAYRDGGVWTDFAAQTDDSGMLLVYNFAASGLPGNPVVLGTSGSVSDTIELQAVAGAVTLASVVIE